MKSNQQIQGLIPYSLNSKATHPTNDKHSPCSVREYLLLGMLKMGAWYGVGDF